MTKQNDGGPAFPLCANEGGRVALVNEGMTLRDYFAGQALIGLLAGETTLGSQPTHVSAYQYADLMLKERDK